MVKKVFLIFGLVMFLSANLCFADSNQDGWSDENDAEAYSEIQLEEITICKDIEDRAPVEPGIVFTNDMRKVFCFTKVTNAAYPTTISHVWYYNDQEMARVELNIGWSSWRTWSSKNITEYWVGDWRVDVLDENGKLIDSINFSVEDAD